jgi:hypothetical protein
MTAPRPVRLQLSRRKGFDLQAWSREVNGLGAVNCARPGKWGNPYRIGTVFIADAQDAVDAFAANLPLGRRWLGGRYLDDLRVRNLACWCRLCARHAATGKPLDEPCPDCAPCHVDVLGELANAPVCEAVSP